MATPTPSTGTATPLELDPEQAAQSLKVSLADLSAKATALYAHNKYEEAAEVYAHAAEMQAEMNGEMSPDNAEILFLYGRALFKVGQSKSDVLGGKAPDAKPKAPAKPAKKNGAATADSKNGEGATSSSAHKDMVVLTAKKDEPSLDEKKKPLFHFEGDENFDGSDSDQEEEEEEEGGEDDVNDDLANAFEIFDLARVLLEKRLELAQEEAKTTPQEGTVQEERMAEEERKAEEEGDAAEGRGVESPAVRHIKERLADTHALLAEISLENGKYPTAIRDSRASLKYKQELYQEHSEIIAEAHFKLSLALEFASVTKSEDDEDDAGANNAAGGDNNVMDQKLRDEAVAEMELAIASTKLKLQRQEVDLATLHNPEENDSTRETITEVKEMIADMEQRLVDLKGPPIDINAALGLPPASTAAEAAQGPQEVTDEVKKNATDLSGLVRKKRKAEDKPAEELESKKIKEGETVN